MRLSQLLKKDLEAH